jgi:hypothetical protein
MSVDEARLLIDDVMAEFPFTSDEGRSKAVAVAAMFSCFCRGMIPLESTLPAFFYLANAEGAGKTTLARLAIAPTFGRADATAMPADESELEKRLLATVMQGGQFILLDNLKGHLDSPALEAFITSPTWEGRVLGASRNFRGPNLAAVFLTGNACTMSPDMRRRSLFINLHMREERAEDRVFCRRLDLPGILARRQDLLSAMWALVQDWDQNGRPKPDSLNASFEAWSEVVAGVVQHAGWGNPVAPAEIQGAADRDGQDMRAVALEMEIAKPYTFGELCELAASIGAFENLVGEHGNDMDRRAKSGLGRLLARYDHRHIGGSRMFTIQGSGHSKRYVVSALP